ncbi:UDP-N-acetylmuramate dehydrogenase [Serpentinimonas raichei]|nr:UDP-N-acetylmuramate dehydrogenase [Serpentinimonas raichei]
MLVEKSVALQPYNTFGIAARAQRLLRVRKADLLPDLIGQPGWRPDRVCVLGGGSNIVLTGDVDRLVLKVEILGQRLLRETEAGYLVEAEAGEDWHDFVTWTLDRGWPGLENLALIPGSVGAAPVQNIGAYGLELQDRFHSLDAVDLHSGQVFSLDAAQCGFGYRDSVFKHERAGAQGYGLAGRALITRVRFWLPRRWQPVLGYLELERKAAEAGLAQPTARQIFDWVCQIRRAKLPDPAEIGNVGSFFKNPLVSPEQCADIIARDPAVVHYPLPDGRIKLAAGWLIEACGWKGKTMGHAGVYEKQALVLVNRSDVQHPCSGAEVMTLAAAIQTSVYERFGIRLEIEPVLW